MTIRGAYVPDDDFWSYGEAIRTRAPHCPYIVIHDGTITITEKRAEALAFPDAAVLLKGWPGQWSSHIFSMTIGDLRKHVEVA